MCVFVFLEVVHVCGIFLFFVFVFVFGLFHSMQEIF